MVPLPGNMIQCSSNRTSDLLGSQEEGRRIIFVIITSTKSSQLYHRASLLIGSYKVVPTCTVLQRYVTHHS